MFHFSAVRSVILDEFHFRAFSPIIFSLSFSVSSVSFSVSSVSFQFPQSLFSFLSLFFSVAVSPFASFFFRFCLFLPPTITSVTPGNATILLKRGRFKKGKSAVHRLIQESSCAKYRSTEDSNSTPPPGASGIGHWFPVCQDILRLFRVKNFTKSSRSTD